MLARGAIVAVAYLTMFGLVTVLLLAAVGLAITFGVMSIGAATGAVAQTTSIVSDSVASRLTDAAFLRDMSFDRVLDQTAYRPGDGSSRWPCKTPV